MKNRSRLTLFALPLTLMIALPTLAADAPPTLTGNVIAKTLQTAQPDKDGRILVSDFTVADARQSATDGVTFAAPRPTFTQAETFADPTLNDQVEVVLTPAVLAKLSDLGIDDPIAHFKGRTLQVRGVRKETIYTGFPAFIVCTVTVDRLEDIKVMSKAALVAPTH